MEKKFKYIQKQCFALMQGRNKKYGDSWKVLSVQSLANLCEMKLNRISQLGEKAPKTEDELIDVINYCTFALIKLDEQKHY